MARKLICIWIDYCIWNEVWARFVCVLASRALLIYFSMQRCFSFSMHKLISIALSPEKNRISCNSLSLSRSRARLYSFAIRLVFGRNRWCFDILGEMQIDILIMRGQIRLLSNPLFNLSETFECRSFCMWMNVSYECNFVHFFFKCTITKRNQKEFKITKMMQVF